MEEELSPAERYARSRERAATPHLTEFVATRPFRLDDFQLQACTALESGQGVLVCAPTGAGKTVVGEFAVHRALRTGGKCFYTTPIKALSNQKFQDLIAEYGADTVGLLTGDTSINSHADVVVMTTEVLRNMLYAGSPDLHGLTAVVMDEIHYLADKFRGAVWEEVILQLPEEVQVVGLSATVSNAEEFGAWLQAVRGHTTVVVDEIRPVPLWQHMMVGRRMFDLFTTSTDGDSPGAVKVDPSLTRAIADAESMADRFAHRGGRGNGRPGGGSGGGGGRGRSWDNRPRFRPPARVDVIERLDGNGLLPAITFIFSRAGCDAAVGQCVRAGMRLTTESEREQIRAVIDRRTADLPEADLGVLGYWDWREALERGIAAHHAGMLPTFKETVEELFVAGLVKAVFATETLALGINMPARTVVLEKLIKYNGEGHVDLTPGEYTQLTGRAGRRGIDIEGHAVVVWAPGTDPRTVAGLASKRTYPLRSSFRPSYNMAVNLLGRLGRTASKELLEQSFAQFQADSSVVGLVRQVRRNTQAIASHASAMECHLGDTGEYLDLLQTLAGLEKQTARSGAARRREATAADLEALHRGDVISVPSGRRAGLAVVLDPGLEADGTVRPLVITASRWSGRLSAADFRGPVPALGRLRLAKFVDHRSAQVRKDVASSIIAAQHEGRLERPASVGARGDTTAGPDEARLSQLRREVRSHPVHGCSDRETHLQWARRWRRLTDENAALTAKVDGARGSLGTALDKILGLLTRRGFVQHDRLTDAGRMLTRIWSESDLVVAECLRGGTWDGLAAHELAGAVSTLVYESRRDNAAAARLPIGAMGDAVVATRRVWTEVAADEAEAGVPVTRQPDAGFAAAVAVWAEGGMLSDALLAAAAGGDDLSAGDFVRWCRQVIDLLDQIRIVAPPAMAGTAAEGVAALRRGVVAMGAV
ncbi:DEAD/DEAH box helicase [Nakamurella sp. YIM 132087]|uniref:DEAD/DEAH box helicase n=1 Tax=Nakamurella alba TaxID=2665158 RepID=A0A7K1FRP0_9ACTN|nr:DEAD/DEAH box helicase [Nakamurella alba]